MKNKKRFWIHPSNNPKELYRGLWLKCQEGGSGRWIYAAATERARDGSRLIVYCEIIDALDYMGRDAIGEPALFGEVLLMDPYHVENEELISALRCSGWLDEVKDSDNPEMLCVEALHCYGAKGILYAESAGTVKDAFDEPSDALVNKLMSNLTGWAEHFVLEGDPEYQLTRVVNKIGTTAKEAMLGQLLAPLERDAETVISGGTVSDSNAILLKMYAAAGGQTLGGVVDPAIVMAGQILKERNS